MGVRGPQGPRGPTGPRVSIAVIFQELHKSNDLSSWEKNMNHDLSLIILTSIQKSF